MRKLLIFILIIFFGGLQTYGAVSVSHRYEIPLANVCSTSQSDFTINIVITDPSGATERLTETTFSGRLKVDYSMCGAIGKAFILINFVSYAEVISGDLVNVELTYVPTGDVFTGQYVAGASKMPDGTPNPGGYTFMNDLGLEADVPDPTLSVKGATLCLGETGKTVIATVTNAPTGYSIEWENDANIAITTGSAPNEGVIGAGVAAGTYNLTATLKDGSGNVVKNKEGKDVKANYTVTVNAKPTISLDKTEICKNESVSFSASGGTAAYSWGGDVSGSGTPKTKQYTAAGSQSYTVNVTDAKGCKETKTGTITVNDLPSVTIAAAKTDVCAGDAISLTATATGGSGTYPTYTWTGATGNASGTATANAGDNKFKVTVTDDKKCTSPVSNEVNVVGHEVKVALADVEACTGSAGNLSANVTFNPNGKQGSVTYAWTPAADVASGQGTSSITSVTYAAAGDHEFTLTVTDGHGCSDSKSAKVKVKVCATPEIKINPLEFCEGEQPTTITASVTGITAYSIDWGNPAITSAANSSTGNISGTLTSGTWTATLKDGGGNTVATTTYTITVNPKPTLSAITATANPVALGGTSTLSVTSNGTVTWGGSPIQGANTGLSITAGPFATAAAYTYTAKATSDKGCSETQSITVTVDGAPLTVTPPPTTPTGGKGEPIPACVTVSGGDCDGNYTYDWTTTEAGVTVTPTTPGCATVTSTTTGTKTICVEVHCGTESKKECFPVEVTGEEVKVQLEWTITDILCEYPGATRTITLTATGGEAGTKYSFVMSSPGGSPALTVNQEAKNSWTYTVTPDKKGIYGLSKFSAILPDGTTVTGQILPSQQINADFYKVPAVYAYGVVQNSTLEHCEGDELVLSGSGDDARYTWNNGVQNGVPFVPTTSGVYEVTGVNEYGCSAKDKVTVNVNPKPELNITVSNNDICPGEAVTLKANATPGTTVTWTNGVVDGVPFRPDLTGEYTATATDPRSGCSVSKQTTVTVKEKPVIVRHSKNPRNIAIGKDVYFAVDAIGTAPLSYTWYRKVNGMWSPLSDNSVSFPTVSGAKTDSLVLKSVPESWDGSELKVVVKNECDTTSMVFQLGVKECFDIEITMLMQEGIIPDTDPTNKIDGWYCRGRRIALRAILSSPEGYEIENGHYRWTIDGLELPEEHFELETDTCVLTWIPEFQEDDIVVKVCGYCDGACEEVCVHYLRLKAREFEKVSVDLLTSVDPEHRFCPGDTVDFWVTTRNVGDSARFDWYNDIFHLPTDKSPKNELLSYEGTKMTLVMGQEDTWVKVFITPSEEVCTEEPLYMDTVFLRKKEWVTPNFHIINDIEDTLACRGDRIQFTAVYENAGKNPMFYWRKDVWDWGHGESVEAVLADKDMWLKCWLVPGDDVCYSGELMVDSMVIRVLENPTVVISADLTNKAPGDEIIIESEVTNMPTHAHYKWYLNYDYTLSDSDYPEYISDKFAQGDVIQCGVTGERICTSEVLSNELVIYFGDQSRDTMITIYKGENIHNLNMRRKGDTGNSIFRITADGYPKWGVASMKTNGHFDYTPNVGFVGSDVVKYEVVDKFDATKVEIGYIYISVLDRERFFIPNIITPNGDGLNDTWKLEFLADYPDHHITIYNRNGVVVFEATNYQNDWGGTGTTTSGYVSHFNLANGVYTYVIDLGNKEILKNWIEIRRDMNRGKYRY